MGELSHQEQDPEISARSAISAEKIVVSLVGKIRQERNIRNRRLRFGLLYGFGHIDIVDYLTSSQRRTEAISHHQERGFNGLVTEDLDTLLKYEYVLPDSTNPSWGWRAKIENMGLFDGTKLKKIS